jgi:hypothetical protein
MKNFGRREASASHPVASASPPSEFLDPRSVTIPIVTYTNAKRPEFTIRRARLGDLIQCHAVRDAKDGPAFSPIVPKPGATRRAIESVASVTALVGDVDHVDASEWHAIAENVEGNGAACMGYTSFSHGAEDPRWRLAFPITHGITPEEHVALWPVFNEMLMLGKGDPATKDCARLWYLPSCPLERRHLAQVRVWHGRLIDVDVLLAIARRRQRPARPMMPYVATDITMQQRIERARAYVRRLDPSVSGQRGHAALYWAAVICVRGFLLDDGAAFEVLAEYNRRAIPEWSPIEIERKIQQARKASRLRNAEGWLLARAA